MTDASRAQSAEEVGHYIKAALRDYIQGGPDKTAECLALGEGLDWVPGYVARAREARAQWEAEKETEVWIKDAREASSFLPEVQPIRAEPNFVVEPVKPVEVEKPRFVRSKSGALYQWIGGGYRRVLRETPKPKPEKPSEEEEEKKAAAVGFKRKPAEALKPIEQRKPEPEEEPEQKEPKAAEETYVEDDDNPANDIRRKLWRVEKALEWINLSDEWIEEVGAALWWMSNGNKAAGCQVFVGWAGEENRGKWQKGFDARGSVERIYREAQRKGWRYPIAHNLNKLQEMAVRVEAALVRAGAEIYQLGNRLVRPVRVEVQATKGRKTRIAVLVPIDQAYLKSELTRLIDFFKWKKGDEREGSAPHGDVVSAVLSRYGEWKFPVVTGVITAPTLRRDGSLLAKEGWDPESGLIVIGPLPAMPPLAAKPSRADAERAIRSLDDLLSEFPFVDGPSHSVALSGLITPVVRAALTCVPLHGASAPASGTGKSLLWDIPAEIALGDAMPIIAAGMTMEETEKRLDAQVIEGVAMYSIDNASAPLGGDALCQIVERPTYKPRVLGKSEMRERRNIWSIFATGNNLRFKDDVTRRVLRAAMDAEMERPELRKFKGNPLEKVQANRGQYLWAALTVVRAYQVAGRPGLLPRIGDTFAEWSDNVRSALVWLGYDDPVLSIEAVRESDPSRLARRAMFQAIFNAYGGQEKIAAEMIRDAKAGSIKQAGKGLLDQRPSAAAEDLKAAIVQYIGERLDAQYLGNKLAIDRNKVIDGLRLCSGYDSHNKRNTWYVEKAWK